MLPLLHGKVIFQPNPEYRGRQTDKENKNRDQKKKLDREVFNCGCTFRIPGAFKIILTVEGLISGF